MNGRFTNRHHPIVADDVASEMERQVAPEFELGHSPGEAHIESIVSGTPGDDTLTGSNEDDTIDGGAGADTMSGGGGNDTYIVDNVGDVVTEATKGGGADTVQSSVTYTLGRFLENLTLTGNANIDGTGNGSDNVITGNAGNNKLDGAVGADTMAGGAGSDTYTVDNAGDVVTELGGGGNDIVNASISYSLTANVERLKLTGSANLNATGNAANNTLTGNSGNNLLDGGAGNDTMVGAAGNDTYVVDSLSDVVTELAGQGSDTVQSSISITLAAETEKLLLTGIADLTGTGNAMANELRGNSGNNVLDGAEGADTLAGGLGNDIYLIDAFDTVTEGLDQGVDTVIAGVSASLADNVENLTLVGEAALSGTGNTLANTITGNASNNTLDGAAGIDTLLGGAGDDLYTVDDAADVVVELAGGGIDTVLASASYSLGDEVERLTLTGVANLSGAGNALANLIIGNAGNNSLDGGAGNDTLNGGLGADTLVGGTNADTYVVDDAGDSVVESAGGGADTVQASISYALTGFVENLTLTGSANINGTGNTLANSLVGNGGNNKLDGGTGADTMSGGAGNDSYVVDVEGDTITEAVNKGTDTVLSKINYVLGSNLENLTLTGTEHLSGTGNSLNNVITGNAGNNVLSGGDGDDTISAGGGSDVVYAGIGNDRITLTTGVVDGGSDTDTVTITAIAPSSFGDATRWYSQYGYAADYSSSRSTIAQMLGVGNTSYPLRLENQIASGNFAGQVSLTNVENLAVLAGSSDNDLIFSLGVGITFSSDGGAGTDTFYADWSSSSTKITLGATGGNGVTLANFENTIFSTGSGADTADLTGFASNDIATGAGADTITLTYGAVDGGLDIDTVKITAIAESAFGDATRWYSQYGYAADYSSGRSAIAQMLGVGNTSYPLRLENQVASGNFAGQVSLTNVENLAVLAGSSDNDLIFSLGVGTTFSSDGGAGTDTFYADWSSSSTKITLGATGGNGVTLANFENTIFSTGLGADTADLTGFASNDIATGAGADIVTLTNGAVDGGADIDTVTITAIAPSAFGDATRWYSQYGYAADYSSSRSTIAQMLGIANASYPLRLENQIANGNFAGQVSLANVENLAVLAGSSDNDLIFSLGVGITFSSDGGAGTDTFYADWSSSSTKITLGATGGNGVTLANFENTIFSTGSGADTADLTGFANNDIATGAGADIVTLTNGAVDGGADIDAVTITAIAESAFGDTTRWYSQYGYAADYSSSRSTIAQMLGIANTSYPLRLENQIANGNFAGQVSLANVENLAVLAGSSDNDLIFSLGVGTTFSSDGGAGIDTFYADWSSSSTKITLGATGGNGVTLANFENAIFSTGSGADAADLTGFASNDISTGNGEDNIKIINGTVDGGSGTDTVTIATITESSSGDSTRWYSQYGYAADYSSSRDTIALMLGVNNTSYPLALQNRIEGGSFTNQVSLTNIENLAILAGSSDNDLLFVFGTGADYHGGGGTDTFYADWSGAIGAITWTNTPTQVQTVNGVRVSGLERLIVSTGNGNDLIDNSANATADDIATGTGNDTINGGAGADLMTGGSGDDTYSVDNLADVVAEFAGDGTDLVKANLSYTLGLNLEQLTLTGNAAINGTGNSLDNLLTGNGAANVLSDDAGNDTLAGAAGNDTMSAGNGNDTYIVDSLNDVVIEIAGQGTDTVSTNLTYTLGDNLENLALTTSAGINATGNALDNVITGTSGANRLDGGAGNDTLIGNAGNDLLLGDGALPAGQVLKFSQFTMPAQSSAITFSEEFVVNPRYTVSVSGIGEVTVSTDGWFKGQVVNSTGIGLADDTPTNQSPLTLEPDSASVINRTDTATPSTPVLGGSPTFYAPVSVVFSKPVAGFGVDAGYFDRADSTSIEIFDTSGHTLALVNNSLTGSEFLGFANAAGTANIGGFSVFIAAGTTSTEPAGFGLDNLYFTTAPGVNTATYNDSLDGGAGLDTLDGGTGSDTLTGGASADQFDFNNLIGSDLVTDFLSGTDKLNVSRSSLPVGDGDAVVEGARTLSSPGGFAVSAELAVFTSNIAGSITAAAAADKIGSATSAYAVGQTALFVVDNGTDSALYYFKATDDNALVSASELTLLATLQGTSSVGAGDFVLGA